ncbi:MAG: class I SAM-dependent methyltransferase [Hyphomicrobium sp.]|uniref:class I SAM-dependent methyltransferase n=1 Tax=Hyphomicrobium sp. TaxID=82 RepID=UPI001320E2FE|nr:class I SAM-dependent methyltransferase [Hyphomicrobium sp.]KAB2944101.1 MAG: class I SAM-dependent methyltransferase [Hyphomicrobium sp.]MBZ0209396.1 class I SAM-dependent methyltransferase [Hyphomicrobium sp.]
MSGTLVEQQFGAAAADYATSTVHARGPSLARLVALVAPQLHWRALDVATGAGHTALAFAPLVAHVIASDITEEMLAEAGKLARARGLTNVDAAKADAGKLPFADASFDLVTCRLAAHHFPDPAAFVGEAWRVLKPGGAFALVDNVSPDAMLLPDATPAQLRDATVLYNAYERLRDPSHARCLSPSEWLELLGDIGFAGARHELLDQDIAFAPWTARMRCSSETIARLATMLEAGPLRAFLRPREDGGERLFTLQEAIIVAHKPD